MVWYAYLHMNEMNIYSRLASYNILFLCIVLYFTTKLKSNTGIIWYKLKVETAFIKLYNYIVYIKSSLSLSIYTLINQK
jgi:hypothetical protein